MNIIPSEVKADGLKIYATINGMQMPLNDDMIKHYCGHLPKTEIEAKIMARRLKGKRLNFPNINMGSETKWEKRRERIERRKRRERNVMKVNVGVELDSDVAQHKLCIKVLEVEGVKRVKKITESSIELEVTKGIKQKKVCETIMEKFASEEFDEIKKVKSIDFQD